VQLSHQNSYHKALEACGNFSVTCLLNRAVVGRRQC
jgi:hypothetical protein